MRRAFAALALVTAGFAAAFALAGSSTSTADDPVALLDQSYAKFQSASLYRKWKQQNPGEATLVESFWANGGTAPTVSTAFGQALVLEKRAQLAIVPVPPPTTTTAPPPTDTEPPPPTDTEPPPPTDTEPPPPSSLACGSSLDAAYDAASAGAVIQLANCSYTGKTITGSKTAPGVVFDLAGSDQGTIGLASAQNVELRNGRGYASLGCQPGRIVLRNYSMTGIFWNSVCNVSWIGGELGPQASDQLNWIYSDSGYGTHDILLENLYVHDNRCVSSGCHYEAIRVDRGVERLTIRGSVFRRNAIFHIFVTSLNGSNLSRDLTFERNCFDQPNGGSSVIALHDPIVTSVDPATLRIRVLNNFAETGSNFRGPFYESAGNTFGPESTCNTWIPGLNTP